MENERRLTRTEAVDFDPVNLRVARALTKQIINRDVICPACLTFGEKHTLGRLDGEEETLSCPGCGLRIFVTVNGWPHHYKKRDAHSWLRFIDNEGVVRGDK